MSAAARTQLDALTGLRFFAAFYVVLYHSRPYFAWAPAEVLTFFSRGFVAVPLFFVLSGFILAYTYLGAERAQSFDRRAFWINRIARIYPVYFLALIIGTPFFLYGLWQEHNPALLASAKAVGSIIAVTTMTQAWIPPAATLWNVPAWSLSNEAFFYAVFPFVALAALGWSRRRLITGGALVWLLSLVPPIVYYVFAEQDAAIRESVFWGNLATYNPLLRLPEFLVGLACGLLFLGDLRAGRRLAGMWLAGAAAIVLLVALALPGVPWVVYLNGGLVPLFALLVFGLGHAAQRAVPVLTHPILIALGEASYAIYILQQPMWNVLAFISKRLTGSEQLHTTHPLFWIIYVAVLIGSSLLTVRVLEKPARQLIRRAFQGRPARPEQRRAEIPAGAAVQRAS